MRSALRHAVFVPLAGLALYALAACGGDSQAATTADSDRAADPRPAAEAPAPPSSTLDVTSHEFSFEVSNPTVRAGLVRMRLTNEGMEPHQVMLARLDDGVSVDDFVAASHEDEAGSYDLVHFAGGVNAVERGNTGQTWTELKPGTYALICYIPSPDGVQHVHKGMVDEIEVVASDAGDPAVAPKPRGEIVAADFSLQLPPQGLTSGAYRFVNRGQEPHELIIVRAKPGKTLADLAAYQAKPEGPQPFVFSGGAGVVEAGESAIVQLDLRPGQHVALCVIPGRHTGQPHAAMGMVTPFNV